MCFGLMDHKHEILVIRPRGVRVSPDHLRRDCEALHKSAYGHEMGKWTSVRVTVPCVMQRSSNSAKES